MRGETARALYFNTIVKDTDMNVILDEGRS
jgi:hypothetical protein